MRVTWNDIDRIYHLINMLQQSILDKNAMILNLQNNVINLDNRLKALEGANVDQEHANSVCQNNK